VDKQAYLLQETIIQKQAQYMYKHLLHMYKIMHKQMHRYLILSSRRHGIQNMSLLMHFWHI